MIFLSQTLFLFAGQTHSFVVSYDPQDIGFSPARATNYPLFIYEFVLIIAASLQSSITSTVPLILYGGKWFAQGPFPSRLQLVNGRGAVGLLAYLIPRSVFSPDLTCLQ